MILRGLGGWHVWTSSHLRGAGGSRTATPRAALAAHEAVRTHRPGNDGQPFELSETLPTSNYVHSFG
ncbi:hypothetical protein [Yinghuangia sp. YIM S09857]|uniref:hypothetical protein n=1 Tax=Yinghuangia sp. YIM S09857 TaxID=3436929 RepID=UPI003F53CC5A